MKAFEKNHTGDILNNTTRLYNPWDPFSQNDFLDFWEGNNAAETIPSINVYEEKEQYGLEMDAPGLKKEGFNIDIDGSVMTISYETESESGDEKNRKNGNIYSRNEYSYSSFSRSFTIPDHTDTNHIVAKYNNGILSLNIPKRSEAPKNKNRKITVQ